MLAATSPVHDNGRFAGRAFRYMIYGNGRFAGRAFDYLFIRIKRYMNYLAGMEEKT